MKIQDIINIKHNVPLIIVEYKNGAAPKEETEKKKEDNLGD